MAKRNSSRTDAVGRVLAHVMLTSSIAKGLISFATASHKFALTPARMVCARSPLTPSTTRSVTVRVASRASARRRVKRRSAGCSVISPNSGNNSGMGRDTTGVHSATTKLPYSVCARRIWLKRSLASRLAPARYTGCGSRNEQATARSMSREPPIRSTPAFTLRVPSSLSPTRTRTTSRFAVTRSLYSESSSRSATLAKSRSAVRLHLHNHPGVESAEGLTPATALPSIRLSASHIFQPWSIPTSVHRRQGRQATRPAGHHCPGYSPSFDSSPPRLIHERAQADHVKHVDHRHSHSNRRLVRRLFVARQT